MNVVEGNAARTHANSPYRLDSNLAQLRNNSRVIQEKNTKFADSPGKIHPPPSWMRMVQDTNWYREQKMRKTASLIGRPVSGKTATVSNRTATTPTDGSVALPNSPNAPEWQTAPHRHVGADTLTVRAQTPKMPVVTCWPW